MLQPLLMPSTSDYIGTHLHCLRPLSLWWSSLSFRHFTSLAFNGTDRIISLHSPSVAFVRLTHTKGSFTDGIFTDKLPAVELIGYAGRIWSHYDTTSIGGFVIQAILILVAPALFVASIYMILGRLIRTLHAEELSLIPIAWVTRVFVISDVISFSLQAGGGGIQAAGTLELFHIGEKIIIAGLFVQIVVFGFFMVTAVIFQYRFARSAIFASAPAPVNWKRHLNVLYTVSALILVRSIFRVIEYLQGNDGYLISHEVFLYVFDALLMTAVMIIFFVWYIDDIEVRPGNDDLELCSED